MGSSNKCSRRHSILVEAVVVAGWVFVQNFKGCGEVK